MSTAGSGNRGGAPSRKSSSSSSAPTVNGAVSTPSGGQENEKDKAYQQHMQQVMHDFDKVAQEGQRQGHNDYHLDHIAFHMRQVTLGPNAIDYGKGYQAQSCGASSDELSEANVKTVDGHSSDSVGRDSFESGERKGDTSDCSSDENSSRSGDSSGWRRSPL